MVEAMQPGSVIVDMAVSSGGNVEGSKNGETVEINGVKIIGNENLPGEVPTHSSQVYANNVFNLIDEFWNDDNQRNLNFLKKSSQNTYADILMPSQCLSARFLICCSCCSICLRRVGQ